MLSAEDFITFMVECRILVVEDHAVVRVGLVETLREITRAENLLAAANEAEARAAMADFAPNLCVMDLLLGGPRGFSDGLALIEDFTRLHPKVSILIFSSIEDADLARRAMTAGARGFMAKSEPMDHLSLALRAILARRFYLSPALFSSLAGASSRSPTLQVDARFGLLTNRERHVLHASALGLPNRRIATDLGLSVKTIETHKEAVKRKLELGSSAELERAASVYLDALLGIKAR